MLQSSFRTIITNLYVIYLITKQKNNDWVSNIQKGRLMKVLFNWGTGVLKCLSLIFLNEYIYILLMSINQFANTVLTVFLKYFQVTTKIITVNQYFIKIFFY